MTGPEHYQAAERLLRDGATDDAQVHATLALAAATALRTAGAEHTMPGADNRAWFTVASESRKS